MIYVWIAIGLLVSVLLWLLDAHLALRKRVATVERHVGVGKPDRIAELLDED